MKAIIISQPKSGTYLCANLLQEFGLNFEGYHLSETYYQKYDLNNLDDSKKNTKKYTKKESIDTSINYIKDNAFAVSHLYYNNKVSNLLKDFKKIIVTRDYNEVVNSWNRFAKETGRKLNSDRINFDNQQKTYSWINDTKSFHITFNDMINKNTRLIDELQIFLYERVVVDSESAIDNALTKKSLTKSDLR